MIVKINFNKVLSNLIAIYIFLLMFGGVLTKVTFKHPLLFELKKILPDIVYISLIICGVIYILSSKKLKIRKSNIRNLIFYYVIGIVILNFMYIEKFGIDTIYILRDNILPFLGLWIFSNVVLEDEFKRDLIKKIFFICVIQAIMGFMLAMVQSKLGWEWTSNFYTGYSFYEQDPISNIKIWESNGRLRVPSLAGQSAIFAYYNVFCMTIFLNFGRNKYIKYILTAISFINIVLATSKVSVVVSIVIICIYVTYNLEFNFKTFIYSMLISCAVILFLNIALNHSSILYSLNDRVSNVWVNIFRQIQVNEYILPINIFNSINTNTEMYLKTTDSMYITILINYGIIGIIMSGILIVNFFKGINNNYKNFLFMLIVMFLLIGITTNIFEGRAFASIFFLIVPIFVNGDVNKVNFNKKDGIYESMHS